MKSMNSETSKTIIKSFSRSKKMKRRQRAIIPKLNNTVYQELLTILPFFSWILRLVRKKVNHKWQTTTKSIKQSSLFFTKLNNRASVKLIIISELSTLEVYLGKETPSLLWKCSMKAVSKGTTNVRFSSHMSWWIKHPLWNRNTKIITI